MFSNSFLIISRRVFDNKDLRDRLTNDDIVAYLLLGDRMKLSIKNKWVDHKRHAYFIYYAINDLAHDLRRSPTTAVKCLKHLEAVKLVAKRHVYKQPTHIFLPDFKFRNPTTSKSKIQSNNNSNNNNNYINTTINTEKPKKARKPKKQKPSKPKATDYHQSLSDWAYSTQHVLTTSDSPAVKENAKRITDSIARIANKDATQARYLFKVITWWRSRTMKVYEMNPKSLGLEHVHGLADQLEHLYEAKLDPRRKHITRKNYVGYVVNSIKHFMLNAVFEFKRAVNPTFDRECHQWALGE